MEQKAVFKGIIYGDIIGAPFSKVGTSNRYFDLGESRSAYYMGRVRTFHPQAGEASFAASSVLRWMHSGEMTSDNLRKIMSEELERHPRADWSERTRASLSSPAEGTSNVPDIMAAVRCLPLAMDGENLEEILPSVEDCVRATCSNAETINIAKALVETEWRFTHGLNRKNIEEFLTGKFDGLQNLSDDDLRSELAGEVRVPLEMLGVPTGSYTYEKPKENIEPSPTMVATAALRAVLLSDSWEDGVRRAVAYGGPSSAVAAIAGGIAEALYGEVTPSIEGRLFRIIPIDMSRQMEALEKRTVNLRGKTSSEEHFPNKNNDIVDIISIGIGSESRTAYVVPEGRDDIMTALSIKFAGDLSRVTVIKPEDVDDYIKKNTPETKEGTYVLSPMPCRGALFLQNGRLVSSTEYMAPGMPPLSERRRSRDAFRNLLAYTLKVQDELNRTAGYNGPGQVHYATAYCPIVSRNRIEFRQGDLLAGAVVLDSRGLLKIEAGDLHEIGANADVSEYKNAEWCRRTIFSRSDMLNPVGRVQQMQESIGAFLLDEGAGLDRFIERRNDSGDHRIDFRKENEEQLDKGPGYDVPNLEAAADDIASSEDPKITRQTAMRISENNNPIPKRIQGPMYKEGQPVRSIFTIGHSNQTQNAFIAKLQANLIDTVISVRSIGRSSYNPQFNNDDLMDALAKYGISFFDAGDSLGGRQGVDQVIRGRGYVDLGAIEHSPLFDSSGRVSWDAVRQSDSFRKSMSKVQAMMDKGHTIALMCSEADPTECHRFGMLARDLSENGYGVFNILRNGKVETMEETEMRLIENYVSKGRIPDTGVFAQRREMAYKVMNEMHGWRPADLLKTKWRIKR